jgi:hypothetical protein
MGQEAACKARYAGKASVGKALLETDELIFRGDFRLAIPLKSVESVEAADGELRVGFSGDTAVFDLGAHAEKWARKIRNPRTLADKLDIKPGLRVSLCGVKDPEFRTELEARTGDIREGKAAKESDLIFLQADAAKDLDKVKPLVASLKRNGAIWVVYPKGRKDITESAVFRAGKQAGLVDVKVARFSTTHTALKFVIPLASR